MLNKTVKIYYGYCHSLDGTTLFFKVDSNKLRVSVKNEITLICAEFGAHKPLNEEAPFFCAPLYA